MEFLAFIIIPFLLDGAKHLFGLILGITGNLMYLRRDSEVERLDDWLAEHGYCTFRDPDGSASGGLHAGRLGRGWFITYRQRVNITSYNSHEHHSVFIWRCHREFQTVVQGDPDGLRSLTVSCPCAGVFDLNSDNIRFREPEYPWQSTVMAEILAEYRRTDTSAAIILGPSGTGKTTLGFVIARYLKKSASIAGTKCEPVVLASCSPQMPGMNLQACLPHNPTAKRPFILVINELDKLIEQAELGKVDHSMGTPSPSSSKGTFLDFIDGIRRKPHVILIATSNSTELADWRQDRRHKCHPYVNPSRYPVITTIPTELAE